VIAPSLDRIDAAEIGQQIAGPDVAQSDISLHQGFAVDSTERIGVTMRLAGRPAPALSEIEPVGVGSTERAAAPGVASATVAAERSAPMFWAIEPVGVESTERTAALEAAAMTAMTGLSSATAATE
jgi:hypothetical protein